MRRFAWLVAALAACGNDKEPADSGGTDTVPVDCSTRGIDQPSPRGEVGGAWDPGRGRFVLFGGDQGTPVDCFPQTDFTGETWAFEADCDDFVQVSAGDGPKKRGRQATASDAERMILHGGRFRADTSGDYDLFDDTWSFDFASDTWTELDAPGGPSARSNHAAVLAGSALYVYGGNASNDGLSYEPLGDTWKLDLTTLEWTELQTKNAPPDRLFHAAATDGEMLYVYGGGDEDAFTGPFFRDLWALDLQTLEWTEMDDGTDGPEGRIWASLTYDPVLDQLVLFGGHDDQELGNRNDLWTYDLQSGKWDRVYRGDVPNAPANGQCDFPADFTEIDFDSPERRDAFASALSDDGQLYVFGGKTDCGIINDVWSLSVGDRVWTERARATAGQSCERAYETCASLCF